MVPSPKSHARLVIVPVEVSAKLTATGAVPEVLSALKLATGAATVRGLLTSLEKPLSLPALS